MYCDDKQLTVPEQCTEVQLIESQKANVIKWSKGEKKQRQICPCSRRASRLEWKWNRFRVLRRNTKWSIIHECQGELRRVTKQRQPFTKGTKNEKNTNKNAQTTEVASFCCQTTTTKGFKSTEKSCWWRNICRLWEKENLFPVKLALNCLFSDTQATEATKYSQRLLLSACWALKILHFHDAEPHFWY